MHCSDSLNEREAAADALLADATHGPGASTESAAGVLGPAQSVTSYREIAGLRYRPEHECCLHFRIFEALALWDVQLRGDAPLPELLALFVARHQVDTRVPFVFVRSGDEGFLYRSQRGVGLLGPSPATVPGVRIYETCDDLDPDEEAVVEAARGLGIMFASDIACIRANIESGRIVTCCHAAPPCSRCREVTRCGKRRRSSPKQRPEGGAMFWMRD